MTLKAPFSSPSELHGIVMSKETSASMERYCVVCTKIVVCCGNKIKDRQLEQSKHVYVVTTDSFDDLKIAYSVMSSSTCKICAFRALLIRFHFLLSHKYISVKVIVMAQSFPAIC